MGKPETGSGLSQLRHQIEHCTTCARLRKHCLTIARDKRRAYLSDTYWGKPIVGFGDPEAQLLIVGLAPAAHGANRTGRIFTGDRSGEWLFRALHKAGFSNQPVSIGPGDGLELKNAYITCVVRCAPPDNKPTPQELKKCAVYLETELELLAPRTRVFVTLGQIALTALWPFLAPGKSRPKFSHGGRVELKTPQGKEITLLMSYHPSQQNTFTGRLTEPMFDSIFAAAKALTSN